MKFTIEASDRLVVLQGEGTPSVCRVFTGTAENGAKVRFAMAHCAVSSHSPGFEPVLEYFRALDADNCRKARLGDFVVQLSEVEILTAQERGQA